MNETTTLGPFTVVEQIGEGGMGAVHRGRHRTTDVPVAIKVIHRAATPEARDQFHREVQAQASLLHPGIVYLFEYGEVTPEAASTFDGKLPTDSPYVAMELADRGTVRDILPFDSWETVCRLLVQILDALAYAHARGVVHRDLKPENLLVFEADDPGVDWRVKLADFGIAHAFDHEQQADTSELAVAAGTPLYMAPEQGRGRWHRYGPWTDLYALGCIAWELVCGRPPYQGETAFETMRRHETDPRPPLDPKFPVPDQLETWLHRAMALEPRERFRRAADALWALPRGVLADGGTPSGEPTSGPVPEQPSDDRHSTRVDAEPTIAVDAPQTLQLAPTEQLADLPELPRAETLPVAAADQPDGPGQSSEAAARLTPLHPPVPEDWRPHQTDSLPTPLIGTGLQLFGLREPPFVDRQTEGDRIWEALHEVVGSETWRLVQIAGRTGTGKSRLAEWMATRAHEVGAARVVRAIHTPSGSSAEGLAAAFERTLRTLKRDRGEVYRHLRETLPPLPSDDRDLQGRDARALTEYLRPTDDDADRVDGPRYQFSDARQRHALLVRLLERLARERPVVLWLDDLQWGTEAVDVLEHLRDSPADPAVLVLATVRSDLLSDHPRLRERLDALAAPDSAEHLSLEPLARPHQRELIEGLLPLEQTLADRLAERTEGHPLFAMQLLGHWIEGDDLEIGDDGFRVPSDRELELPDDIHHLWNERIERLLEVFPPEARPDVRRALELAAALGREVDDGEWRTLVDRADLEVPAGLVDRLVERGLAERTTGGFAFAHRLLVDTLARRARAEDHWQAHHRRCARLLETKLPAERLGLRERLAGHWVEAGHPERALEPLLAESRLAKHQADDTRRRRLLARRAKLIDDLGLSRDDPRRLDQKLERANVTADRDDLEEAREATSEVWETLDDRHLILRARAADLLARLAIDLGEPDRAERWAERAIEASRGRAPALHSLCHRRMFWIRFSAGDVAGARKHVQQGLEAARRSGKLYAKLESLQLRGMEAMTRGDEQARDWFERIQRQAADAGYVVLEARGLNGLGEYTRFRDRLDEAREYYRKYLQKLDELSRPRGKWTAELNLALVELRAGRPERGFQHLQSGRQHLETVGAEKGRDTLLHLIHLTHAAGVEDEPKARRYWEPLRDGWPDDWGLIRDYPWLLETAADYADRAGWTDLADDLQRLADHLWEAFDEGA